MFIDFILVNNYFDLYEKFSFTKCGSKRYFSGSLAVFASHSEATISSFSLAAN